MNSARRVERSKPRSRTSDVQTKNLKEGYVDVNEVYALKEVILEKEKRIEILKMKLELLRDEVDNEKINRKSLEDSLLGEKLKNMVFVETLINPQSKNSTSNSLLPCNCEIKLQNEILKLQNENDSAKTELSKLTAFSEAMAKEKETLISEFNALEESYAIRLKAKEDQLAAVSNELENLSHRQLSSNKENIKRASIEEKDELIQNSSDELELLKKKIHTLENFKRNSIQQSDALYSELTSENEKLKTKETRLLKEIERKDSDLKSAMMEIRKLIDSNESTEKQLEELKKSPTKSNERMLLNQVDSLKKTLESARQEKFDNEMALMVLQKEHEKLEANYKAIKQEHGRLQDILQTGKSIELDKALSEKVKEIKSTSAQSKKKYSELLDRYNQLQSVNETQAKEIEALREENESLTKSKIEQFIQLKDVGTSHYSIAQEVGTVKNKEVKLTDEIVNEILGQKKKTANRKRNVTKKGEKDADAGVKRSSKRKSLLNVANASEKKDMNEGVEKKRKTASDGKNEITDENGNGNGLVIVKENGLVKKSETKPKRGRSKKHSSTVNSESMKEDSSSTVGNARKKRVLNTIHENQSCNEIISKVLEYGSCERKQTSFDREGMSLDECEGKKGKVEEEVTERRSRRLINKIKNYF